MILSVKERMQFQYLLPMQGSLELLEKVEGILKKVFIEKPDEEDREFIFDVSEIHFMQRNIDVLDKSSKLNFGSLSVVRKIMEETI
jgi:hypothetical protein